MAIKGDTRERMITAALELFHLQGVNATSIDQILERSKTGKSQYSHYFKTKDGLVRAVIQSLNTLIRSGQAPTGYKIESWKDMQSWFNKYIDFQKSADFELSCPIGTIGNDISDEQEVIRQDIRIFLEWCGGQLARFFAERKAAGDLLKSADPDAMADFCLAIMQGGMLLTKIKRDSTTFENAAGEALKYINSLRRQIPGSPLRLSKL